MNSFIASFVEDAALARPEALGFAVLHGDPSDRVVMPTTLIAHELPLKGIKRQVEEATA